MTSAIAAGREHQYKREEAEGRQAASAFASCARRARGRAYQLLVLSEARSTLLETAGRAGTLGNVLARPIAARARALYVEVATSADTPADLRVDAARARSTIEHAFPNIANDVLALDPVPKTISARTNLHHLPSPTQSPLPLVARAPEHESQAPRVMPAPSIEPQPIETSVPPTPQPVAPLEIHTLSLWTSDTVDGVRYVHIRINMIARQRVIVRPGDFKIAATSDSGGRETVRALASAAPDYSRIDYTLPNNPPIRLPTVARFEDLGALGSIALDVGDAKTVVCTFPVRRDTLPEAISATLTWTQAPQ